VIVYVWPYGVFFYLQSFKDTNLVVEDGNALLSDIHERISNMMQEKVEAVKVE